MSVVVLGLCLSLCFFGINVDAVSDYRTALTKSLLFFEAQRSGKLPTNQRVKWRGDSALKDGSDAGVDLSGGYYDAGDNVKFGFPMAYTITLLAWGAVDFEGKLKQKGELSNALAAIRWGTDYLIKAHPEPNVLFGGVGDGQADHSCWQRPEDMTSPRTTYKITNQSPGADLAAESAAALAAASIAFQSTDRSYSKQLLTHARQLFDFARNHPGQYQSSIPSAGSFYSSSGYQDELLWAAAWLQRATDEKTYVDFLGQASGTGGARQQFSWDDKYLGAQLLVAKLVLEGKAGSSGIFGQYKSDAETFLCNYAQKGSGNFKMTAGGMLWFLPWGNLQYVGAASLAAVSYASYLSAEKATIQCPGGSVSVSDLYAVAQSQADYVLGNNPKGLSYMVGFGSSYPTQPHHRGASIVSIKKDATPVTCQGGFDLWFNRIAPNPNVLDGAIVGGPNEQDGYTDSRSNYQQAEPATATVAPYVGLFASLA
ncbi:endoglucanase 14-like [Punica granatum]|uniref:Endoglucanase n=2 Tax=Punica granatum TaxID=22663 RepID=A0A218XFV2_PUNGR|nr:endoglucanase 14-like [Punica granatum]OWM83668.1 hypothetical protein CDL15_Pgr004098 [Punica granatum]PKI51379.1 hypothetical protein CRG98_028240 [Punica granatum]